MPAPVRVRTTDGDGDGRSLLIQTGWWKRGNFRRRQREVTLSNFREINDDDGHSRVCTDVHRVLRRLRSSHTAAAASVRGAGPSSFFGDPFRTFRPTGTEIFGIVPLFFSSDGACVLCAVEQRCFVAPAERKRVPDRPSPSSPPDCLLIRRQLKNLFNHTIQAK